MSFIKDSILEADFEKELCLSEMHSEQKYHFKDAFYWLSVLENDLKEVERDIARVKYALSQINSLD